MPYYIVLRRTNRATDYLEYATVWPNILISHFTAVDMRFTHPRFSFQPKTAFSYTTRRTLIGWSVPMRLVAPRRFELLPQSWKDRILANLTMEPYTTYFWLGSRQTHTLSQWRALCFAVILIIVVFLPQATYFISNTVPLVRGQAKPWRPIVRSGGSWRVIHV